MNDGYTSINRQSSYRRASVLIAVVVCLGIATALVTAMVRTALETRRTMRTEHHVRQTEMLLAAGIQRARQQLSPTYTGETWELPPSIIPHTVAANVLIAIAPANDGTSRTVRVTARLSTAPHKTIQRSYTFSD